MNPATREEALAIVKNLNDAKFDSSKIEVVIAPPALYLYLLQGELRNEVKLAAQNAYIKPSGAFTGEISPSQLSDAKIPYVILGHSERRTIFQETSPLVALKTKAALDVSLKVILCIGETLEQREAGKTSEVNEQQLSPVVDILQESDWSNIVIAYEPVWAIGTGRVATCEQAQETQAEIRAYLRRAVSPAVADATRIIYGGSVTGANCSDLAKQPDVDGFLVGGASLKPEFVDIINSRKV